MRAGTKAKILAAGAVALAAAFALFAFLSFRASLGTRLDRAQELESAAVRPAAAARLAAELAAHRLALVAEGDSRAVAGAFRRTDGEQALEAYRSAGGNPAILEEALLALNAEREPEPGSDVAFLRAIRALRAEAAGVPSPARPEPPALARRAGWLLVWAMTASVAGALLAFLAGRSLPSPTQ